MWHPVPSHSIASSPPLLLDSPQSFHAKPNGRLSRQSPLPACVQAQAQAYPTASNQLRASDAVEALQSTAHDLTALGGPIGGNAARSSAKLEVSPKELTLKVDSNSKVSQSHTSLLWLFFFLSPRVYIDAPILKYDEVDHESCRGIHGLPRLICHSECWGVAYPAGNIQILPVHDLCGVD